MASDAGADWDAVGGLVASVAADVGTVEEGVAFFEGQVCRAGYGGWLGCDGEDGGENGTLVSANSERIDRRLRFELRWCFGTSFCAFLTWDGFGWLSSFSKVWIDVVPLSLLIF